mmetsp:Transcript_30547/g.48916  ORF Transcript_30547/g.48916 Transcript_30547/m.48916 type:complete len:202 (+) Transcript_30547:1364-1969(+)
MSCPAAFSTPGTPPCPKPVIRAYMSLGFSAQRTSGPRPSRSITPGRNGSMITSAFEASLFRVCFPSCSFKLSAIDRFPLESVSILIPTVPSLLQRSIRTTSAPKSARTRPAKGAGASPAISSTLMPASGSLSILFYVFLSRMKTSPILFHPTLLQQIPPCPAITSATRLSPRPYLGIFGIATSPARLTQCQLCAVTCHLEE